MKTSDSKSKLRMWQKRYADARNAYDGELGKMDERERIYRGDDRIKKMVANQRVNATPHVRNIAAELIEAQVSASIPGPKVTARYPEDEHLARVIEAMLRNELDRLPIEQINDMASRTVPIQGGTFFLVEWDSAAATRLTSGELALTALHPKAVVPQDGVFTSIEDMDYIFVRLPETKAHIADVYGVDVDRESEEAPEIRGADGVSTSDEIVTRIVAYYRNSTGGIGLYSWVGDVVLEDLEDYQARRLRRCAVCGQPEPVDKMEPLEPTTTGVPGEKTVRKKGSCPYCGSTKWETAAEDYEELWMPVERSNGEQIGGARVEMKMSDEPDESGMYYEVPERVPERVPYYKPDIYPVILQRNVSLYGKLLGDSDIDRIRSQQNTTNRLSRKIVDKLVTSGSVLILPPDATIEVDERDGRVARLASPEQQQFINVLNLEGNISQDVAYLEQVYQEARQTIGVTDSFQGRRDSSATSGKAKEFAAAQTAGRLDSKRAMRDAAYAAIFEAMFKFKLAYADEPRPVVIRAADGSENYEMFNRWDFLKKDTAGEWYWDDYFLFSVDASATLASNREAMWQETRLNLQSGAFGNPADPETLVLFWRKMEQLHYPGAGEAREYITERISEQRMRAQQQMMAQPPPSEMQAAMQQIS